MIVTGHTRTDVAETMLYRLAASPGSRALLGLSPRSGRVVRPLLGLGRERIRELAIAAGLPFADDETNDEPLYARNRIRAEVLPVLRDLNSGAEPNIAETRAELAEEAALLERVVLEALAAAGAGAGAVEIPAAALAAWEPGLRRLALRALAERAAGRQVPLGRERAAEIERLAAHPEGGTIELGGGLPPSASPAWSASAPRRGRRAGPRPSPWRSPGWPGSATGRCAPSFIPARSSRPAPTSPRSTRARSRARSRSAPGATATASGRSGCRARRRSGPVHRQRRAALAAPRAPGRHRRRRGRLGRRRRRLRRLPARARHRAGRGADRYAD